MTLDASQYLQRGVVFLSPTVHRDLEVDTWTSRMGLDAGAVVNDVAEASALAWNYLPAAGVHGFVLTKDPRDATRDLSPDEASVAIHEPELLAQMTPPFAVVSPTPEGVRFATDSLGFRQLYVSPAGDGIAASSSARALAMLRRTPSFDLDTVAVQTRLGWQLGSRTLFEGVRVVHGTGTVGREWLEGQASALPGPDLAPNANPVKIAAQLLRTILTDFLDEHPDAELQLTGGLDSRILLSAIPLGRRRGLHAMTLVTPDSEDASIAAQLAEKFGLEHRRKTFAGLDQISPAEAFQLCITAARRLDCAADPIALAAVDFAEGSFGTGPRIVGLGGEVARGFYYLGPTIWRHMSNQRIARLIKWRLFANESAPTEMFTAAFREWADDSAFRQVKDALTAESLNDWFRAVDGFYLNQRTRRWAGVLGSAACLERAAFNPMLDPRFIRLVSQLSPQQKENGAFLAGIVQELDPELARIPMDGRPSPETYARRSVLGRARISASRVPKLGRKVRQWVARTGNPPNGGTILSDLVVEHLRANPRTVEAQLPNLTFLSKEWLDKLLAGDVTPSVAGCAQLVTLLAACPAQN